MKEEKRCTSFAADYYYSYHFFFTTLHLYTTILKAGSFKKSLCKSRFVSSKVAVYLDLPRILLLVESIFIAASMEILKPWTDILPHATHQFNSSLSSHANIQIKYNNDDDDNKKWGRMNMPNKTKKISCSLDNTTQKKLNEHPFMTSLVTLNAKLYLKSESMHVQVNQDNRTPPPTVTQSL